MIEITILQQIIFVALISLCLGSFAGMLVYRIPNGKKIFSVTERSRCPKCENELSIKHNIPVLSYITLKGKCAFCKEKISPHYFLVELTVLIGITFTFIFFQSGWFDYQVSSYPNINLVISDSLIHTVSMMLFVYWLIILGAIDIMTGYLPDKLTYSGMTIAITFSFFDPSITVTESIIGMCAGYLSLWSIAKLFKLLRGIEGMGHGDFKILAMIGAFLGWQSIIFIPMFASIVGILFAIIALKTNKYKDKNTEFPFGQYLAAAAFILIFINTNVIVWYLS